MMASPPPMKPWALAPIALKDPLYAFTSPNVSGSCKMSTFSSVAPLTLVKATKGAVSGQRIVHTHFSSDSYGVPLAAPSASEIMDPANAVSN